MNINEIVFHPNIPGQFSTDLPLFRHLAPYLTCKVFSNQDKVKETFSLYGRSLLKSIIIILYKEPSFIPHLFTIFR